MQTQRKSSLRMRVVIPAFLLMISGIGFWLYSEEARARAQLNWCVATMKNMEDAAVSYSLENKRVAGTMINPNEIASYMKGGVPPVCLSGDKPYPPFETIHGPRCPSSAAHNQAFIISSCQYARAAVWSAALCYAAANGRSWSDTVDPNDFYVGFYLGKARDFCPMATNGYAPFILSQGPRCPVSPEHNAGNVRPWRNEEFFDEQGMIKTNRSLTRVSTNNFFDWNQSLRY